MRYIKCGNPECDCFHWADANDDNRGPEMLFTLFIFALGVVTGSGLMLGLAWLIWG